MPVKPWKLVSSNQNSSYRIFNLRTDRALSPRTNKESDFYIIESSDWVNIIPVTPDNQVILIRQYRHGIQEVTLEIPGGLIEAGDSPKKAAERELREETGYEAGEMIPLGNVHANPAFLNNRCYTFFARDVSLVGMQNQDENEDIEIILKPLDEVPDLIEKGEITHSLILVAFFRFFVKYGMLS